MMPRSGMADDAAASAPVDGEGRLGAAELEQLVEVGADWTWQTDARHHFTHFSSGVEAATGLKPARAVGKSWFDFFSDAARRDRKYEMHVADLKALRPFRDFIYEIAKPGENCRYVSVSGFPRFDEDGAFAGYCGSGRNVTAMVEALDELRETRRALALRESRKKLVHDAEGGRSHAERLMAALNAMHDAFCYYDSNNTLVLFNDAMVDMYAGLEDIIRPGVSFETMMATALERGVILAGGASPETLLRQVLANRREQDQWEAVLAFGDGRFCMHREIRTDDGGTIGICTDVTDLKRREEELARAKDRSENLLSDLQRTIDSMAMGVVLVDAELRAETINRAFYEIWKVTPQDVAPGSHFRALMDVNRHKGIYDVPDAEWEGYVSSRLAEIRAGDVAAREFHRADGCTMIYSVTALSGGKRLISYYDVSEMKQREADLAHALEQAKLAAAVIDSVSDPIFVKDEQLDFVVTNKAFASTFGAAAGTMLGRNAGEFVPAADAASFEQSERAVLETGEPYEIEEDFVADGQPRSRIVRKNRVTTASGKNYVACTIFDVTELKRRESEASDARAQLELVVESLSAGVLIYDRDDRLVIANRKMREPLPAINDVMQPGRSMREILEAAHANGYYRRSGDAAVDALYDTDREAWIEGYAAKYHVPQAVYEREHSDGRWYKIFDTRTPEGFFIGVRVDITEQKEREAALQESMRENEIFRSLIDNVPVAIYAKRPDLRLMYVNKGWTTLTGYSPEEAIGRTDGEVFGAEEGEAFMQADREVLEFGRMVEAEETATHPDGTVRKQIARKSAFRATDGSLYLIGSTTDITELKQREAELEEARRKAILADRAKSEFLANMSHEIRTPMNGVLGMAELMSKTDLDAKQRTFIDIIVKSGNALLTIINDILDFSKIDAGQLVLDPAPFNLAEAIEDVATLVSTRAKEKDLELIVRVQPGLNRGFVGDVGRLRQIITNLLGNAVKFTDKGHVLVDVSGERGAEASRLKISVTDTGIGIPADKLALIFDKFSQVDSSSTRRHEGTGLGLAITSRLVELMGGQVGVESEDGKGSTFWFTVELPHAGLEVAERITPMDITGARVLIVDDNDVNRAILSEQMASWRFDACAVESGVMGIQVLKAAASQGLQVDCVVLDYQMPGMTGAEMARLVRATPQIRDVPIVMLTSVDQSLGQAQFRDLFIDAQLIKPVRSSLLLETLVTTIQKGRSRGVRPATPVLVERAVQEPAAAVTPAEAAAPPPAAAPATPVAKPAPKAEGGLDILVAEDNEVNQLVFTQILSETAHRFHIVGNGELAVAACKEMRPRMILMDVSMPTMNGLEATAAIRAHEAQAGTHVPIVGVTAHALKGDRERCLEAGMDDYLSKPISPDALLRKVATWLDEAGAEGRRAG
jgi:PAS domain S-box-containing protein